MDDMVAIVFKEEHRASKIFYQLQHEAGKNIPNLRNAIVFIPDNKSGAIVEQTINLNDAESLGWSKFWGAFIKAAMLTPFYYNSTNLVEQVEAASKSRNFKPSPASDLWSEKTGISMNAVRDLKALLQPSSSAILMVVDRRDSEFFLETADFSGGHVVRIQLDEKKIAKIRDYFR